MTDAEQRCRELTALGHDDPYIEALGSTLLAVHAAMRGSFEQARLLRDRGRELTEELGLPINRAGMSMMFGRVDQLAGDDRAAEAEFGSATTSHATSGGPGTAPQSPASSERLFSSRGARRGVPPERGSGAGRGTRRLHDPDEVARTTRLVLAEQGRMEEAESLVRESVELARPGDDLDDIGICVSALGRVLERAGKLEEARAAFEEALDLWERKGNVVSAAHARESLARSPDAVGRPPPRASG